ncbi:MAG: hypothetical protein VYE77_06140 [Planctomycetota bacterium]|nr:hypothetical protein [Planctomycetota bacterium]
MRSAVLSGVTGALLVLPLVGDLAGQFVAPEGSNYHNGSGLILEDERRGVEWLVRLEQSLSLADASGAVSVMRSLRAQDETWLVAYGPRTHVPAIDRAAQLIMQLGDAALIEAVLADARQDIAAALARRDLSTLLDHATRARSLPVWREAAWGAARLLFEQGRWWEAASLAARLPSSEAVDSLVLSARARLPVVDDDLPAGPWSRNNAISLSLRSDAYHRAEALPLVVDGRPDEVLLLDHMGLQGLALEETGTLFLQVSFRAFDWPTRVLGAEGPFIGLPAPRQYSLVRSGDRVVLPFNVASENWRGPEGRRQARLLAIDLPADMSAVEMPTLAWSARVEGSASSAFGPPLLSGERLFCLVFRGGLSTEVSLAAYGLADGRLLFETPLVRGSEPRRYASRRAEIDIDDVDKRAREGALAVRDGVIYACTGFGVVAAVDALTGQLRHSFRYDRVFAQERDVFDPAFLFDRGGWNHEPVRLSGDRVVVAPSDSRFLYMLALEPGPEGYLIREDPIERLDRRDIVMLLPDPEGGEAPLVLATRQRDNLSSLVLLGANGHTLATSMVLPEGELQTGRPLLVGGAVVLPTSRGLRLFAVEDLGRPAVLVAHSPDSPVPQAVYATRGGLMILYPESDGGLMAIYLRRVR